jgi:hypothetical protein
VEQLTQKRRVGAIWSINSVPSTFPMSHPQHYNGAVLEDIATVRTDLNSFSEGEIACLENHGYWLADAAIRSYASALPLNPAATFTYPHADWMNDQRAAQALKESGSRNIWKDVWRAAFRPLSAVTSNIFAVLHHRK